MRRRQTVCRRRRSLEQSRDPMERLLRVLGFEMQAAAAVADGEVKVRAKWRVLKEELSLTLCMDHMVRDARLTVVRQDASGRVPSVELDAGWQQSDGR